MAKILQTTFSNVFAWKKMCIPLFQFPKCTIDSKSVLVQAMTWCWTGNNSLPESYSNSLMPCGANTMINPLFPRGFQRNFRKVIFQLILVIDGWCISCKIVLKWTPMDLTDGKSTLVQVMAWCRQATSHYLSQCWPRSLSPYGIIRPQWVNCAVCPIISSCGTLFCSYNCS